MLSKRFIILKSFFKILPLYQGSKFYCVRPSPNLLPRAAKSLIKEDDPDESNKKKKQLPLLAPLGLLYTTSQVSGSNEVERERERERDKRQAAAES